ncbi:MAG: aminoglycoside phosphotransferase family protein [Bdellovibrionales bacterium]
MTLEQFCKRWNLQSPEQIATTPTSSVYKVIQSGETRILKLYTDLGRNCESEAPYFFKTCKGRGVADIYQFNDDGMVMEYITGKTLKSLIDENRDKEATQIIAQTLRAIHNAPQNYDHHFQTLEQRFESLFRHAAISGTPDIVKRAAFLAKSMLRKQSETRLLHGDMHHDNIMQRDNGDWVAIDPQPLIGDPAYDCANTLHNPHQTPQLTENIDRLLKQAKILAQTLEISQQKIINYAYIHGCLSTCWSEDDGTDTFSKCLALKTSEILEPHAKH